MKKALFGVLALLILAVAAVLVVPGFIDWNEYKAEIAAQAKRATGRDLTIGGDIRIAVFPAPALVAEDLRLSAPGGEAGGGDMARLGALRVRVALGPLIGGQIQVEKVELVDPVVLVERRPDGSLNWSMPEEAGGGDTPATTGGGGAAPDVRLDNFLVENGTLIYRDGLGGEQRIEALSARVAAVSLAGPFEATGSLIARGVPLDFEAHLGKLEPGRPLPVNLAVTASPGQSRLRATGTVEDLERAPAFAGTLRLEGADLAALAGVLAGTTRLPGPLGQAFEAEATVKASAAGLTLDGLSAQLGQAKGAGSIEVTAGDHPRAAVDLKVNRIDLDEWLALPPAKAGAVRQEAKAGNGGGDDARRATIALARPQRDGDGEAFALPQDIAGALNLSVGAVTYRGGVIGQLRANLELNNGEVTLNQFSAQLPGGSDVALFGFVTAADGKPKFEGEAEVMVSDSRGVANWLGVELPALPPGRLRKVAFTGKISAQPDRVQVTDADLRFDSSRLTGGATFLLSQRLSFGASLALDRLDLDPYLDGAPAAKGKGDTGGLAALKALTTFDANLKARVHSLVYRATPVKDVELDATLYNGDLTLRRASVGAVAGARAAVTGTLGNLGGMPDMKDLKVQAAAADLVPLARLAGLDPALVPPDLGAVALSGTGQGSLLTPKLALEVSAAGGKATFDGGTDILPTPAVVGRVTLRHGDLAAALQRLGVAYRPAGPVGAVDLAADVRAGVGGVTATGVKATVGKLQATGDVTVALGGARPKVTAKLTTNAFSVDPLLPAQGRAAAEPAWRHALWRPGESVGGGDGLRVRTAAGPARERWSRDPIDLAALRAVDADLTLRSPLLTYGPYLLGDADVAARLDAGVLRAERLNGKLFDGALRADAVLDARAAPRLDARLHLARGSLAAVLETFGDAGAASGTVDLNADLASDGTSVAALVAALSGKGDVALRGIDVKKAAKGSAMTGLLNLVTAVNGLGNVLSGGKAGSAADVTGTFDIQGGVLRSRDLVLKSGLGDGDAVATVDLPAWRVEATGEVRPAQNVLTQILAAKVRETRSLQKVPFSVNGPLDAPNVKLETGQMPGGGVAIPVPDSLRKKKGVGAVLDVLVPRQQQPAQEAAPAPAPPPAGSAAGTAAPGQTLAPPPPPPGASAGGTESGGKRKLRAEDILRGLIK
ncbi:MAG: AsmA family protein [Hyphomicrobiales bacterium]|nr:AsmA family protein [Hyphomicrobiales bacterium]